MRTPTTPDKIFGFYWRAIAGERQEILEDEPQAGFWKMRLKPKCAWVPVKIWLVQEIVDGELIAPEVLKCTIDGAEKDPREAWVWCSQRPIDEHEFHYLQALRSWQKINEPESWDPYRPIDMTETAIEE